MAWIQLVYCVMHCAIYCVSCIGIWNSADKADVVLMMRTLRFRMFKRKIDAFGLGPKRTWSAFLCKAPHIIDHHYGFWLIVVQSAATIWCCFRSAIFLRALRWVIWYKFRLFLYILGLRWMGYHHIRITEARYNTIIFLFTLLTWNIW